MSARVELYETPNTDVWLLERMRRHYSQPRGFVGRNICYAVMSEGVYFGHIVAGSATLHLPGRHEFFGTDAASLNNIVNNTFYNVSGDYPCRNFTTQVVLAWEAKVVDDWMLKYGDHVVGFETLVELPRTGELYRRAGWTHVGQTKGFTCKREAGQGTDDWSGRRVWNTDDLKPKAVLCKTNTRAATVSRTPLFDLLNECVS